MPDGQMTGAPLKIAVIGGGIGGLTAALSLRQAGFEVDVFEQAPELTQIGGGINMGPNATRVLRRYERLRLPRVTRLQQLSRANKTRFHMPDGPAQQARDAEWARMNNGAGDRSPDALRWLYEHDPAALRWLYAHDPAALEPVAG
jgi:2-polyprenyl-6-methoxyphenol hydroxylase-like FAD-dependent oxidoreductase